MLKNFIVFLVFGTFQSDKEGIGSYSTEKINDKYFWSNDLTVRSRNFKSEYFNDTIANGYYSKKEVVTFKDQKIYQLQQFDGKSYISVSTLVNGTGYLRTKNDTITFVNGLLNGPSFFHHHAPLNKFESVQMSDKEIVRSVITFDQNFLKSNFVYKNGILVFEAYYKSYDFIRVNRGKIHNDYPYLDSLNKCYFSTGQIHATYYWKKGHNTKYIEYNKAGEIINEYPKNKKK